jgi:hypothetical protein
MSVPVSANRKRRGAGLWVAGIVIAVLAGLGYYLLRPNAASASVSVPTATAKRGEFQVIVTCRGELIADKSRAIVAPVNVPNLQIVWLLPQGTAVKANDAVIRFDASAIERQLKEQEATLAQAQATLDQAISEGHITNEQDKLDLETFKQAAEKARLEASKAEILSAIQAEEDKVDLGLAEQKIRVQLATIEHNLASSRSKIGSLTSQRNKAQLDVNVSKERIAKMEVHAPSAGVISYLMNNSQGWLNAKPFAVGDTVWPGSGIAEVPDLSSLRLKGKIEEIDRGRMLLAQPVRVLLDPFPEKRYVGKLEAISPLTEQTFEWPPTRSFRAYASLGETDSRLRPGMNGRMDVVVDKLRNVVSVPAKAVFAHDGRPVVLVPGKNGMHSVRVEVLARNPDEVAINGIEAGTQVALVDTITEARNKAAAKGGGFEVKTQ